MGLADFFWIVTTHQLTHNKHNIPWEFLKSYIPFLHRILITPLNHSDIAILRCHQAQNGSLNREASHT